MSYFRHAISLFILLGILFIPFSWNILSFHKDLMIWLFQPILGFLDGLLGIDTEMQDLSSDSKSLYILVAFILILSLIFAVPLNMRNKLRYGEILTDLTNTLAICFLSAILMKYGFDKVFKTQFYLPEPNLLYTPLGNLDKDILFWSTMGSSYSYNLFMGSMELFPAFLILFKRTRTIGLIISLGVLINVLAINLSFDISVKLFVSFLLIVTTYLLIPSLKPLWQVFFQTKSVIVEPGSPHSYFDKSFLLKTVLLILITCEAISPYTRSGNYQDDLAKRPQLHGAYEVISIVNMEDTTISNEPIYKRMFVHRDGFLIFQDQQDKMIDLKLNIDPDHRRLELINYDGHSTYGNYQKNDKDSTLLLKLDQNGQTITVLTKQLNWRKLPLLRSEFHWTVD